MSAQTRQRPYVLVDHAPDVEHLKDRSVLDVGGRDLVCQACEGMVCLARVPGALATWGLVHVTDATGYTDHLCRTMHETYERRMPVSGLLTHHVPPRPWNEVPAREQQAMRIAMTDLVERMEQDGWVVEP